MKILVYFNSMSPAGGIERVVAQHLSFMAIDHEVILVTNDDKPSFYDLPFNVTHRSLNVDMELNMFSKIHRIYQIVSSSFLIISKLKKLSEEINPDFIYVASPLTLLLSFLSQKSADNILVTEHSSYSAYNRVYKTIASFLYKKVGLLTVPTTMDSDFYNSVNIKNEYLPNPLSFYPKKRGELQNKIVLNIGRFTDDKQHLQLIDIWNKTTAKNEGWILKIIGKGENSEKIVQKIKALNLEESVIIENPTKEIEKQYLNASIFVLTSRAEGFGLVLAEAMACGIPCVSFNCPSGPRDIIDNSKDGFLIEPANAEEFTNKIDLLASNFELREKMGIAAKSDIRKFRQEIISKKLLELINEKFSKN